MKKIFSTKSLLLICMFFISITLADCNLTNAVCENNKQNTQKENNIIPQEKCSSDIYPSGGLNIKI